MITKKLDTETVTITHLVKDLEMALRAQIDPAARSVGLTSSQFHLLSVISADPGISSAQLARQSYVSPQATAQVITALEGKGLLKRQPTTANRRVLGITLTRTGTTALKACEKQVSTVEEKMTAQISETRMVAMRKALIDCLGALPESE